MGKKKKGEYSEEKIQKKIRKLVKKLKRTQRVIYSSADENYATEDMSYVIPTPTYSEPQNQEPTPLPSVEVVSPIYENTFAVPAAFSQPAPLPALIQTTSDDPSEADLDDDILKILGDAPEPETVYGKAVHKEVATRWVHIIKTGLTTEVKEQMAKDYLIPSNCEPLVPPILNPEAKVALNKQLIKRDALSINRQEQLSTAISALAQAVETIIGNNCNVEHKKKMLKPVNDAARIMCNMYHNETQMRRNNVISSINTGLKDTLKDSTADKFLFGDKLSDKLKAAKFVLKSGEALKPPQRILNKNNCANKNWVNFQSRQRTTVSNEDAWRSQTAQPQQGGSSAVTAVATGRRRRLAITVGNRDDKQGQLTTYTEPID